MYLATLFRRGNALGLVVGGVVGILGGVCQYLLGGMVTYSIERPRVHVLPNNSQTGWYEDRKASLVIIRFFHQ